MNLHRLHKGFSATLLVSLALSACAGPTVQVAQVPTVPPPASWRTDAGPVAPIDGEWWRSFGDPVLTGLVEQALANNADLGIAMGRVREARANIDLAHSQLLPSIDASLAGGRSRSVNPFGQAVEQNAAQPQVQTAWEIDLFGRLADQQAAARDNWFASQAARDAARLSIASATASTYITLRALDARLEVAKATLAARAESLRIARSRVDNGYSPRLELNQAQAEYDATAQIVPQIALGITRAENALSSLIGDPPRSIERGTPFAALREPPVPEGLPSTLLTRRPDIAQAELALAAADKSLSVARKRFLPQLRLTGSVGAAISSLLADPITIWSIGGSILAPIFEGGRLRAGAEASGAQRDQAAFAYRRAVLNGFREVEDALASAKRLDEQLTLAIHQRDTLAEALRLATNRFREGYSPFLEQLDAQRGLLAAELSLIQIRTDALNARVQLYQAMGGGWSRSAIEGLE